MRFATLKTRDGTRAAMLHQGDWRTLPWPDLSTLLWHGDLADAGAEPGELIEPDFALLTPWPRKIICAGLNFADHIAETGREPPQYPTLFAKFKDTLTGPTDEIVLPHGLNVDWEVELTVVVGATLRHADRETAKQGIAGYTVANDISVRDWQYRTLQWFQGKAWDATTPVGPVLVTPDEFDPAGEAEVVCRVNGEEVQRDRTKTLVFDAADLIAYASTFTTLRPGDLILTGTCGGVGHARKPPRFLEDGDVVETEVTGIGTLRNRIRFED